MLCYEINSGFCIGPVLFQTERQDTNKFFKMLSIEECKIILDNTSLTDEEVHLISTLLYNICKEVVNIL